MLAYEFPDLVCLSQDLQGNVAWALEADVMVGWGLYHKPERRGDSAVARLGVFL